jgi:hypothetical protein
MPAFCSRARWGIHVFVRGAKYANTDLFVTVSVLVYVCTRPVVLRSSFLHVRVLLHKILVHRMRHAVYHNMGNGVAPW